MNKESCDMQRFHGSIKDWWENGADAPIGSFLIHESTVSKAEPELQPRGDEPTVTVRWFTVMLPNGTTCTIPLRPVPQTDRPINGGHSWEWDGNEEKPTLTPSINSVGVWHGWVRAGRLVSC